MTQAEIAVVGVLCLINLWLLTAVIRRLRQHEERLSQVTAPFDMFASGLDVGVPVPDFTAVSLDGAPVSTADLAGPGPFSIAFLSATCGSCEEKLDDFVSYAGQYEDTCVAVISDDLEGTSSLARRAREAPRLMIVTEDGSGIMTSAFQVASFPMFFRLRDGQVQAKARSTRALSSEPVIRSGA